MVLLKKESIDYLNEKLSLPATGFEQDWEVELADSIRVGEFLSYYKNQSLSSDEKKALISLILASYDDFLNENNLEMNELWNDIRQIIESEYDLFKEIINYWCLHTEDDPENWFKITLLMRRIQI